MQDLDSGEMVPIDPKFLEGIKREESGDLPPFTRLGELNRQLQQAKDATIPIRERQGPIFEVGEELEIRGGRFRVHAIAGNRLYLDSLPKRDAVVIS